MSILQPTTPRLLCVGIDPGGVAGLVALTVDAAQPSDSARWRWADHCVILRTTRVAFTSAECRIHQAERARLWMRGLGGGTTTAAPIDMVAIERPGDLSAGKGARDRGGQRTGTAFSLGESYGSLLIACENAGARRVFDYGVGEWMPKARTGNFRHVQKRERTLEQLNQLARSLPNSPAALRDVGVDENVLMAFGVLRFHLVEKMMRAPQLPRAAGQ